jgi:hypothetical protein
MAGALSLLYWRIKLPISSDNLVVVMVAFAQAKTYLETPNIKKLKKNLMKNKTSIKLSDKKVSSSVS